MGSDWQECLQNKRICRQERLSKYYQTLASEHESISLWIIKSLGEEYPEIFSVQYSQDHVILHAKHTGDVIATKGGKLEHAKSRIVSFPDPIDAFDALAMQVPEDLVIQQCTKDYQNNHCDKVHLCHANGWSAEWAITKTFDEIHARVPNIESLIRDTSKMLKAIVESPLALERIGAVNFRTSAQLNRHPEIPEEMRHIPFDHLNHDKLYLRFERQCTIGFQESSAFLFTIRTYRTQIDPKMPSDKWQSFVNVMKNSSDGTNSHRFLEANRKSILSWIEKS